MSPRTIALYATDTMADWEYAYLTTQIAQAEQARPGRFTLTLVGDGLDEVTSLGGMPVRPTRDVADLVADGALAALVLPGGEHYDEGHERVLETVTGLLARDVPVAAICGATFLLARAGLLDDRRHTSNDPGYLQLTGYTGGALYADAPVVTDRGITTASGIHAVPFTAEVMRVTGLYPDDVADAWEQLFRTGETRHFHRLMEATSAWQNA
ncbi:DJ-1/PfpI family protein [Tsukamurella sp. DT100]|uniref:DJ-1/PfpI family protein n=1 Tax=Tsukamurella sp. DT100 TaxID=3393415 RepID=UPI003CEB0050